LALVAALLGAGEAEGLAQRIKQDEPGLRVQAMGATVDVQDNIHRDLDAG
jgi:hypothetical protein